MNAGLEKTLHPSIKYYDGDYPSKEFSLFPENFDDIVHYQGLAHDVEKYLELANYYGKNILELCCGTGRVALPLAAAGNQVTAIDFSPELLRQFEIKLNKMGEAISQNISIVEADITRFSLETKSYDLAICAFNSLLCITDFNLQQQALYKAAEHLRKNGLLVLDLMNPFILNFAGDIMPRPFFTRKNPVNGNLYTRFAAMGPMQADQTQKLFGWYDEITTDGILRRTPYEMYWRPVFRYEIELMLEKASFKIIHIYGGHQNEPFTSTSRKMFIEAIKL